MRSIGHIFFLLGVVALGLDFLQKPPTQRFELRGVAEVWRSLDQDSWQAFLDRMVQHESVWLWSYVVQPILTQPLFPLLILLGVVCLALRELFRLSHRDA